MYRLFQLFLMCMGGIFLLQITVLLYLVLADPFQLRPLVMLVWQNYAAAEAQSPETAASVPVSTATMKKSTATAANLDNSTSSVPKMTAAQQAALKAVGVDPQTFSQGITEAQFSCFVTILGAARVGEIKTGAVPTATEFFSVRSCL